MPVSPVVLICISVATAPANLEVGKLFLSPRTKSLFLVLEGCKSGSFSLSHCSASLAGTLEIKHFWSLFCKLAMNPFEAALQSESYRPCKASTIWVLILLLNAFSVSLGRRCTSRRKEKFAHFLANHLTLLRICTSGIWFYSNKSHNKFRYNIPLTFH